MKRNPPKNPNSPMQKMFYPFPPPSRGEVRRGVQDLTETNTPIPTFPLRGGRRNQAHPTHQIPPLRRADKRSVIRQKQPIKTFPDGNNLLKKSVHALRLYLRPLVGSNVPLIFQYLLKNPGPVNPTRIVFSKRQISGKTQLKKGAADPGCTRLVVNARPLRWAALPGR